MKWNLENRKEFFAYIEKLTDEDKYTECITSVEHIPMEQRDYEVWYQLARAYQYLTHEEERAIPYALRWAELDPEEQNALEVVKECKEEIEKRGFRVNMATEKVIDQETAEIDEDWGIYLCNAFACDLPAVIRTNLALRDFEYTANYPNRLHLQILYKNADDNGFSTKNLQWIFNWVYRDRIK